MERVRGVCLRVLRVVAPRIILHPLRTWTSTPLPPSQSQAVIAHITTRPDAQFLRAELSGIFTNSQELLRMVENCRELLRIVENCRELSGIVRNCLEISGFGGSKKFSVGFR